MATVLGSQIPRVNTAPAPAGFNHDHGEDAIWLAAKHGLHADEWQQVTVQSWMRQTKKGLWCAKVWGITVPRQNGKNGALEIVELYGMVEMGLAFLHTAHEVKTARKAFIRLKYFFGEKANDENARFPELNAMVKTVRSTNGQEAIILKNGGSCEFIARSKGSGRGFTADVLVLDEAQDLQDEQLEALLPTISAAPKGDPVTIYMGTPPAADELEANGKGAPFVRVRAGAVAGTSKAVAWVEFSAPGYVEDMTPAELLKFVTSIKNHALANPAYGIRVLAGTIAGELEQFSPESFARERLNVWPKAGGRPPAISSDRWSALGIEPTAIPPDWQIAAFGVDMNPERTKVTISAASFTPTGICVELVTSADFNEEGTQALIDYLWLHAKRTVPVVMDGFSPAKSISAHLIRKKMKVRILTTGEMIDACGGFYDGVLTDKNIVHYKEPRIDNSLAGAIKKKIGTKGQWVWDRMDFSVDLAPTVAITCAHFGAIKFSRRKPAGSEKKRGAITAR